MRGGEWGQMEEDYRGKEITSLAKSPHIPLVGKGTLLGTCQAASHPSPVSFGPFCFQPSRSARMHYM